MKKIVVLAILITLCFSLSAFAAASTVQEVLNNPVDDQRVTLEGKFVERIRHEKYYFEDTTGKIRVEIDDDYYLDKDVKMGTPVRIYAKVDFDRDKYDRRVELEVKKIEYL